MTIARNNRTSRRPVVEAFSLRRRLLIVSLLVMLVTAATLIFLYRADQIAEHTTIAARENEKTLAYLTHLMDEQIGAFVSNRVDTRTPQTIQNLDSSFASALGIIRERDVLKLKLYNLSGTIVYSSAGSEIGGASLHPDFLATALRGETVHQVEFRDTFLGISGEMHGVYVALTYMPLMHEGKRIGVIELYADVTPVFKSLHAHLLEIALLVLGAFTMLYAALFFAVSRADRAVVRWQKNITDSEAVLREFQLIAGLGTYILDIRSGFWPGSEVLNKLLGIDEAYPHSVEGWRALLHPDNRMMMIDYLRNEVIGQRKEFDKEFLIIRQNDQAVRWVHGLGKLEFDARGYPLTMHGTLQDITERKLAEERLHDSENRFRAMMEQSPLSIQIFTPDGYTQDVNRAWEKMWGIKREALAQYNVLHDKQLIAKGVMHYIEKAFAGEATEVPAIFYDLQANEEVSGSARKFWVRSYIYPLKNAAGDIQEVALIHEDINERKEAEEALRVAAVAFETHDAILITDACSNIVRVNRAFTDITGYSLADVLGKNPRIMNSGRQDKSFYVEMWQQLLHSGVWAGEIWDKRKNGQVYPKWMTITSVKDAQQEVTHYVGIFSDITERKRVEEEIYHLAFYDALTRLPNRRLFLDRFQAALVTSVRHNDYGAVLFIDLDRFKALNDTLGHDYGDLLLIEVGVRIKSCVREMDTVARFGGDEFVVLIEAISNDSDDATHNVSLVAEKIREALSRPYELKEHEYHSSPSIGISLYHGNDESMELLIEHADMAMYQAKSSGRNAVRFFDPVMQHNVVTHDALENDLHHALALQQLHLHYQIQVDNDNRPLGAEALLRWIHPDRGVILPGQFLSIAEESTLIIDIGRWVLHTACRQLALWSQNDKTRGLTLTVNISARQFAQPDFVHEVGSILRAHQAAPTHLKLELSEKLALTDIKGTMDKIHALKNLGVRLSMDNFAAVYSSLSYLKQLSSDQLKIHQEFVQGITLEGNDAQLVQTIVDLAKSLELGVFAEGVETKDQKAFLEKCDCNAYQGYLFGRPESIEEFEAMLGRLQGCHS
jgi:diguanylate cyclase (GGDEF)-like protein/PAS domain S-box-containing protein